MGLNIVGVYDGDKAKTASKNIEKRKDFQRMIRDAATGAFQYIIVYMFDRFARNKLESRLLKHELMQKYGVKVLSATQPISDDDGGELYEMIIEWKDEKYSRDLSIRVKDGIDTVVENGTFSGGFLIYGYKKEPSGFIGRKGNPIPRVVIDEEQAPIVRYVFEQYDKGVEKKDIAAALNAEGYRLNGKPFKGRSFDTWLLNPKYTGEFALGDRVSNNMYPPIIDKALFKRVQKRLEKNRYFAGGTATARVPYF
jgi:DNA invertase Pin-like site-specific DNA recombinase